MLYYVRNKSKENPTYQNIVDSLEFKSGPEIDSYEIEPDFVAVPAARQAPPPSIQLKLATKGFLAFVRGHPCIGARSVGPASKLFVALYPDMSTVETAVEFVTDFGDYLAVSDHQQDDVIKTMAAMFITRPRTQDAFAEEYWRFAQICHDIDPSSWDPTVSADPNDPTFELSLAGRAVFTTTLNPGSPRNARRFSFPTWVMNQTRQFDALRNKERRGFENEFDRWQTTIRKRDSETDPSGEPNPVLVNHGEGSAFGQLAGSAPTKGGFTPRRTQAAKLQALTERRSQAIVEGASERCVTWLDRQIR